MCEKVERSYCNVCYDYFVVDEPAKQARILSCGHTFCFECLEKVFHSHSPQPHAGLRCPNRCTILLPIASPLASLQMQLQALPRNYLVEGPPPLIKQHVPVRKPERTAMISTNPSGSSTSNDIFLVHLLSHLLANIPVFPTVHVQLEWIRQYWQRNASLTSALTSQLPLNAFSFELETACMASCLQLNPAAPRIITAAPHNSWQMAVGSVGMTITQGAGIAFFQLHVRSMPADGHVVIGLVAAEASCFALDTSSAYQHVYPGQLDHTAGWFADGLAAWRLPGPAPPQGVVRFGLGDRVGLVLDCRAQPMLQLLVNGQQCLTQSLLPTAAMGIPPLTLYPAVALCGISGSAELQQACVEITC